MVINIPYLVFPNPFSLELFSDAEMIISMHSVRKFFRLITLWQLHHWEAEALARVRKCCFRSTVSICSRNDSASGGILYIECPVIQPGAAGGIVERVDFLIKISGVFSPIYSSNVFKKQVSFLTYLQDKNVVVISKKSSQY